MTPDIEVCGFRCCFLHLSNKIHSRIFRFFDGVSVRRKKDTESAEVSYSLTDNRK